MSHCHPQLSSAAYGIVPFKSVFSRTAQARFIPSFKLLPSPCATYSLTAHLKRTPLCKWEGSFQLPLLSAPAFAQFVVPDHHLFSPLTEAGVNVESNVTAFDKVHSEPGKKQRNILLHKNIQYFNYIQMF